jgi:hypothetical protein
MTRPEQRRISRAEGTVTSYARALAQVAKLERENARLKEALQEVADDPTAEYSDDMGSWDCYGCKAKREMARAALTQKEDV